MSTFFEYTDYDEYVEKQKLWYANKVGKIVYVQQRTIDRICKYRSNNQPTTDNILCHGTRSGDEQKMFAKNFPDAYIIGSEIGEGCEQWPNTVQWDFNKVREEWVGKFDLVYTNCYDHTTTPVETTRVWGDQLREGGFLCIEYAQTRSRPSESDPMGATNEEVESWIVEAGMKVVRVIRDNIKHNGVVFVCEK